MRRRNDPAVWILGGAVALLALWRSLCVLSGPDVDTDAYAHHMIARAILADPHDLAVHWVWLPLFHYAQVPLVALGGSMQDVRWTNVALSALLPVVLYRYVRRTARSGPASVSPSAVALFASLVAALCPIAMQMGTTAQSEPLFALMVLGVAIAFQERRYAVASIALGASVLVRYEAWAIWAGVVAILVAEWPSRQVRREPRTRWLMVIVPALCILAWAILRRPVDGRWFGFLGQTRDFANDATHQVSPLARAPAALAHDVLYYPVSIAMRVLGPAAGLAALGLPRALREQGVRFCMPFAACLGFVSLTWVTRSSLGLDRHFVSAIPLYAVASGQGVAVIADGIAWSARRLGPRRADEELDAVVFARGLSLAVAVGSLVWLSMMLVTWMGFWQGSIRRGWPDRSSAGAYLRALPEGPVIFCDEATVEILSGVDWRRFDRHWLDDPHTWELVFASAQAHGTAYVATWSRKLASHRADGTVVFEAGQVAGDPQSGLAILKVSTDAGRAAR